MQDPQRWKIKSDFEYVDAKFYYLRNILHDHTDASCDIILGHIKAAMEPGSVLLVD
jgi:hypothetical protein